LTLAAALLVWIKEILMIKITLTPLEVEDGPVYAYGTNFSLAAVEFLKELNLRFNFVLPVIFSCLGTLAEEAQNGCIEGCADHRDFSQPEDNFNLIFEETSLN
jgi:hypothetical protein